MRDQDLQAALKTSGFYKGALDGVLGAGSHKAIGLFLSANKLPYAPWGKARRVIAAKQLVCKAAGIETGKADGLLGPQTSHAFEVFSARLIGDKTPETWRDDEDSQVRAPVVTKWPRQIDVRRMTSLFGRPGENLTQIELPYPMRIAWDKTKLVSKTTVHEKTADSVRRVLERVADAYSPAQRATLGLDLFGGCYNERKARGSSALSMHSWAIAWDFDPERNQLKWGANKARLAQGDCVKFWRLWEEEGWLSLGRARNYDWMHVQAAVL